MESKVIFPSMEPAFRDRVLLMFTTLVRLLNETDTTVTLVAITMSGSFESVEMWAQQTTYAGREGYRNLNIPDDQGLGEKEAFPVYEIFDRVFAETFPALKKLPRVSAAFYVQWLMRKVSRELIEDGKDPRGTEEYDDLKKFAEGIVAALKRA